MTAGQHPASGGRRKSRELAMQMLYQADIGKQTPDQVRANFWKAADEVEPEVRGFAEDLFRVAVEHQERDRRVPAAIRNRNQ